MRIIKKLITENEELVDEFSFLAYENKRMGEFFAHIGLTSSEVTDLVIEGNEKAWERVITEICNYRQLSSPKVITKGK